MQKKEKKKRFFQQQNHRNSIIHHCKLLDCVNCFKIHKYERKKKYFVFFVAVKMSKKTNPKEVLFMKLLLKTYSQVFILAVFTHNIVIAGKVILENFILMCEFNSIRSSFKILSRMRSLFLVWIDSSSKLKENYQ